MDSRRTRQPVLSVVPPLGGGDGEPPHDGAGDSSASGATGGGRLLATVAARDRGTAARAGDRLDAAADVRGADDPYDGPRLTVAAVARRLGVAPATLRTWARRYGLQPSGHAAGTHRRYTAEDIARLEAMRRLTLTGVPPSEAARVVLHGGPVLPPQRPAGPPGVPGGRVLPLPGADGVARGLARTATALDSHAVLATVRELLATHGVVRAWDDVLRPVLAACGARWATTGEGVEVEHLLSDCVVAALREAALLAPEPERPVLLACTPGEQHALPLHVVVAGLAERGIGARLLGPALPWDALEAAVRRTGPAALFLWAQRPGTADAGLVRNLPLTHPGTLVVLGGPGWGREELPDRAERAHDLASALVLLEGAVV